MFFIFQEAKEIYQNTINGLKLTFSRLAFGDRHRIQILSTIAEHYSNKDLKAVFTTVGEDGKTRSCSGYEITKARLHSKMYGAAAPTPSRKFVSSTHTIDPETISFVLDFIHNPDCVQYSSYKTVSCEGKGKSWISDLLGGGQQPVLWLKQNKSKLYDKYKLEFENKGIKHISKTMFFKGLSAGNFCTMAEQAGLCNICTEYGAENFVSLLSLLEKLCLNGTISVAESLNFSKHINELKGYLLSEYSGNLQEHSNCAAHCIKLLLSDQEKAECTEEHQLNCEKCVERFNIISEIRAILEKSNKTDKGYCVKQIEQIENNLSTYVGHLVRGKYQRMKFTKDVQNLQTHQVVAVADYMMKLLFQKLFEPQRDWFAKKGVSVYGTMFLYKNENNQILTGFHDLYSEEDDRQNWFFSVSCIEESFRNFKTLHPTISEATLWTDNGAHYKNISFVSWLPKIKESTSIKLTSYRNFEPQMGKTKLDGHYATIKFSLKRFRHEGNDVMSGRDIERGTQGRLRGTHVYGVNIDRASINKNPARNQ